MPLSDEHTSVVDALGQPQFEYLGLQPSLQEVLQLETEHVIELHAGLVQHSDTHQPSQEGVAFKQSPEREREREREGGREGNQITGTPSITIRSRNLHKSLRITKRISNSTCALIVKK